MTGADHGVARPPRLLFGRRPPPPVIVQFRENSYRPVEPAEWLLPLLAEPARWTGHLIVLARDGYRTRPLWAVPSPADRSTPP